MFCPKCGALLRSKQVKDKTVMFCTCGYSSKDAETKIVEKIEQKEEKIEVVGENEGIYPLTDETCEKCGHKKAFFWTVQTRAGDEAETKFFKCEKCGYTWREYS